MFSKYSNVEVPRNYSGNRFRQGQELKTETKTHPATNYSATKSSVSPAYHEQVASIEENEENECESSNAICEECELKNEENVDHVCENEENPAQSCEECQRSSFSLGDILKGINSEDLLLICLIIFLSADGGINNNDIVILLALLLAFHT